MNNGYEKVIDEVIALKEKVYGDFKKSGCKNFREFIKNDVKGIIKDIHENISEKANK